MSTPATRSDEPITVDRYTTSARINHWVTAVCLILLALSGFALVHSSLFFLTVFFGGGEVTRIIHPWLGVVVFFGYVGLFIRFWRTCLLAPEDITWLLHLNDAMTGHEEKLPEVGKYNPGQKGYFWGMSVMVVVLLVSGLVIWDQYFDTYTTIEQKRIAVLVHSIAAMMAICGLIVHVHMVLWERGTLRAMTRGWVTGGWGWKHHRKWLRQAITGKTGGHVGAPPAE